MRKCLRQDEREVKYSVAGQRKQENVLPQDAGKVKQDGEDCYGEFIIWRGILSGIYAL